MSLKIEKHAEVADCIVTKQTWSLDKLVRFVVGPNGDIVPDLKKELPGEAVWVLSSKEKVEVAVRDNLFEKALGQSVDVRQDLYELVDMLLYDSVLKRLSLANKSGTVIAGFSKVHSALESKKVIALLHAKTASLASCKKLDKKFLFISGDMNCADNIISFFSTEDLSQALGLSNAVHVAMKDSGATASFLNAASGYKQYIDTSAVMSFETD